MAGNSISISPDETGNESVTVKFTKRDFSQFISSLITTPREERKHLTFGYDLTKRDVKALVEKINHQVGTLNVLLNTEITFTVGYEGDTEVSVSNSEQFFNVDDGRHEEVKFLLITISYMIGLVRSNDERNYEKQIVSIAFIADRKGGARISIRSTEVSWPATIFPLIEREITAISKRTLRDSRWIHSNWLPLSGPIARMEGKIWSKILFSATTMFMLSLLVGIILGALTAEPRIAYKLSGDRTTLVSSSMVDLIALDGICRVPHDYAVI